MKIVAFADNLMDRSRISGALGLVYYEASAADAADADVVIVDLGRATVTIADVHAAAPRARIVAFGPHVDDDALRTARAAGATVVMPRSQFFRSPAAAISETA